MVAFNLRTADRFLWVVAYDGAWSSPRWNLAANQPGNPFLEGTRIAPDLIGKLAAKSVGKLKYEPVQAVDFLRAIRRTVILIAVGLGMILNA